MESLTGHDVGLDPDGTQRTTKQTFEIGRTTSVTASHDPSFSGTRKTPYSRDTRGWQGWTDLLAMRREKAALAGRFRCMEANHSNDFIHRLGAKPSKA